MKISYAEVVRNLVVAVILVFGVSVAAVVGYLVYRHYWNKPADCEIRFKSVSDVVRITVLDMGKFREFVSEFIPCEEGYFLGNAEGVQWGAKKYKVLEFLVDDSVNSRKILGGGEDVLLSYGISEQDSEIMSVLLQFDRSLVTASISAQQDFTKTIPFAVAAGANLWKEGENAKIIDGSDWTKFTLDKSGLNYEVLVK